MSDDNQINSFEEFTSLAKRTLYQAIAGGLIAGIVTASVAIGAYIWTLRDNIGLVPTGSVVAFNAETCPDSWGEFKPAYGKFVRGIDRDAAKTDQREVNSIEEDALQQHSHNMESGGAPGIWDSNFGTGREARSSKAEYKNKGVFKILDVTSFNNEVHVANETRPINVALLYCVKE